MYQHSQKMMLEVNYSVASQITQSSH